MIEGLWKTVESQLGKKLKVNLLKVKEMSSQAWLCVLESVCIVSWMQTCNIWYDTCSNKLILSMHLNARPNERESV